MLYYCGNVVDGVYDNRLSAKPTKSAVVLLDVENRALLRKLFEDMYGELLEPKKEK